MKVLVLNCGSSSVKFQLFEMDKEELLVSGHVSRIGSDEATLFYKVSKRRENHSVPEVRDHERAIDSILKLLVDRESGIVSDVCEIDAVGHR